MERPKPATAAWIGLGVGVSVYEVLCPPGETLSEGVDRALETRIGRVVALGAIAITASHLANLLPQSVDPYHRITKCRGIEELKDRLWAKLGEEQ